MYWFSSLACEGEGEYGTVRVRVSRPLNHLLALDLRG